MKWFRNKYWDMGLWVFLLVGFFLQFKDITGLFILILFLLLSFPYELPAQLKDYESIKKEIGKIMLWSLKYLLSSVIVLAVVFLIAFSISLVTNSNFLKDVFDSFIFKQFYYLFFEIPEKINMYYDLHGLMISGGQTWILGFWMVSLIVVLLVYTVMKMVKQYKENNQ